MSQNYLSIFGFPEIGLSFFTVYGPRRRSDAAHFWFTQKMMHGYPIKVYGEGKTACDFTVVYGMIDKIARALDHMRSCGEYRVLNIGDSRPVGPPLTRSSELKVLKRDNGESRLDRASKSTAPDRVKVCA